MDKKRRVEQHTWAGNAPEAWHSSASDLFAAAAVLREYRESGARNLVPVPNAWRLHPTELMLDGMAIECLLKSLWVKRGNKLAEGGAYLGVPGAGDHDLVQLAGALHLTLSASEKDLLRRLSHFIEYGGRYPVPKAADKLQLTPSPRGGRASATHWNTPGDQLCLNALISRLESLLDQVSA